MCFYTLGTHTCSLIRIWADRVDNTQNTCKRIWKCEVMMSKYYVQSIIWVFTVVRICMYHLVYHVLLNISYIRHIAEWCAFELHQGHITNGWTSNALHADARMVSSTFAFALLITDGYIRIEWNKHMSHNLWKPALMTKLSKCVYLHTFNLWTVNKLSWKFDEAISIIHENMMFWNHRDQSSFTLYHTPFPLKVRQTRGLLARTPVIFRRL